MTPQERWSLSLALQQDLLKPERLRSSRLLGDDISSLYTQLLRALDEIEAEARKTVLEERARLVREG